MNQQQIVEMLKNHPVTVAGLPFVEREGKIDTQLPTSASAVDFSGWSEDPTPEFQMALREHLQELEAQEREHEKLAAICARVVQACENVVDRMGMREIRDAASVNFGVDVEAVFAGGGWDDTNVYYGGASSATAGAPGRPVVKIEGRPPMGHVNIKNEERTNVDDDRSVLVGAVENIGAVRKRGRPNASLPSTSTSLLKEWLYSHRDNPYPSQADKDAMAQETGLSIKQINNWFINARRRYLPAGDRSGSKRRRSKKKQEDDDEDEQMDNFQLDEDDD